MRQPDLKSQSCLLFPAYLPWCPWIYRDLNDESFPSDLGSLSLLQDLDLSGNNFVNPPAQCIINLSMLQNLSFNDCPRLKSLPMLPPNLQGLLAEVNDDEEFRHELHVEEPTSPNASSSMDKTTVNIALELA
ncbi:hypothetical protein JHK84_039227 [Glycine max]|nr:hypothetical protein JHK84_039227 [Glycine max]